MLNMTSILISGFWGFGDLRQAVVDARAKDSGFARDPFVEMVNRTMLVRDDLWPDGSDPDAIRNFARAELLDPDLFS